MATARMANGRTDQARYRLAQGTIIPRAATPATPRLLTLLLVVAPLLVGCTLLVEVNGGAALACGVAAGAVLIAWPWWKLYRAMRENERIYPTERLRPWWRRWPWGSPHPPRPRTTADRFFAGLELFTGILWGLFIVAWLSGLL